MKKLLSLIGFAALIAGCHSTSDYSARMDNMDDWRSAIKDDNNTGDHMWNGGNPNAVPASTAVSPGVGATETKPGTTPR